MRIVWSLAWAQLRHLRGRWALLAAGIALVVAVPVITGAMSAQVSAQTIRRTIASLDLADRSLLVNQDGGSALRIGSHEHNDVLVRRDLARVTAAPVIREMLFRQLTAAGASFYLGAADHLGSSARIVAGRLPRTCTPHHCETVVIGNGDGAKLRHGLAQVGIVVVGRAERTNPLLAGGSFDPGRVPVVLGSDVAAMARLAKLVLFGRNYEWVAPVDPNRVVALGTAGYVARAAEIDAALSRTVGGTAFVRPDAQLLAAQQRADTSTRRFGLLGGFAAVLLLGFAVVAAIGLRREGRLLATVLARRGATAAQATAVTGVEVVVGTAAGVVGGLIIGAAVAATRAQQTGRGPLESAAHAIGTAVPSVAVLALAAAAVAVAVLLWPDTQARAVWRLLDLVALACLGAAVLATDRGTASGTSGDPLIVALPVLASVVAALVAARVWAPVARLAERVVPRRSIAARMALLGAVRRPLRPVATVAFLTAATASVVFAGAYRATLLANDADQAAYQVPLDAIVGGSDTALVPPIRAGDFGAGAAAYAVRRTSAGVTRIAGVVDSTPTLAVDAAAIAHARDWGRTTGSSVSAAALARSLQVATPPRPRLPAGTRRIAFAESGFDPNSVVRLWLGAGAGQEVTVGLEHRGNQLVGTVPPGARAVVGVGVDESFDFATHRAHTVGEGNTDQPSLAGTLHLGAVYADGRRIDWDWTSWGSLRGRVAATRGSFTLGYKITGTAVVATPGLAAVAGLQVPVAVDPQTARNAHGGVLPLSIDATTSIAARIVAVLPRLPTVSGPFILADRTVFTAALDLREPGGNPTEYWVSASPSALDRTLAGARFHDLGVQRRDSIQAGLEADPIGRGARDLLMIVALLALAVAAVALVLLVVGERRDGAGELYAWEADGTRPATLRRMLAVRMLAVAAVGIPVGVVAGLLVARAGATLVAVDASGSSPTPPLAVTLATVWTPLALVIGIGAGVLCGMGVAALALRERFPVAAEADLR
jgi:hypothetical protein